MENKSVELWDGYTVNVDMQLLDDFDFTSDLAEAQEKNDIRTLITMYMALIGGEETYQTIREHIEADKGYFSSQELMAIIEKVNDVLPKSGNRAQRRSWKPSR